MSSLTLPSPPGASLSPIWKERRTDTRPQPHRVPALWQLVVYQLNPHVFDFTPAQIAPLLNLTVNALRKYCRQLWPDREDQSHWRLDFDEACVLIYVASRSARKVSAERMFAAMVEAGTVSEDFPTNCDVVQRALKAIHNHRQFRSTRRYH